jgi:hypothetical protein
LADLHQIVMIPAAALIAKLGRAYIGCSCAGKESKYQGRQYKELTH